MSKLTPKIMDYINTVQSLSIRKIERQILEKFDIKISRETIRKYKNSLNDSLIVTDNQKIVKKVVRKNNGKTKKKKDLGHKLSYFSQVINSIHINAHPPQKKLLKQICGNNDILTVREWIISRYTEALTN